MIAADAAFMAFPSSVRDRFGNDPSALFAFVHDSSNRDEAISLGLIGPPPKVEPPASPANAGAV